MIPGIESLKTNEPGAIQRIISLVPSTTEILYFLGLSARVAGVTEHCDYPGEARSKDKVGTFGQPQLPAILSLKPDLVLADSLLHRKLIKELQNNGVKVHAYTFSGVDDVLSMMTETGRVCGIEKSVRPAIDSLGERVHKLGQKPDHRRPRVFRLMSTDPFITPGPGSFQYDALRKAGARLMDFKSVDAYVKVPWDRIKEFDPEVILFCGVEKGQPLPPKCRGCAAANPICRRTADDIITGDWEQISAVRKNRVHPIPCHTICRPGPRLIDGMEKLHKLFFQS